MVDGSPSSRLATSSSCSAPSPSGSNDVTEAMATAPPPPAPPPSLAGSVPSSRCPVSDRAKIQPTMPRVTATTTMSTVGTSHDRSLWTKVCTGTPRGGVSSRTIIGIASSERRSTDSSALWRAAAVG